MGHSVRNLIERLDPRIPEPDELLDDARELDLNSHALFQWAGSLDPIGGIRRAAGGKGDRRFVGDCDCGAAAGFGGR